MFEHLSRGPNRLGLQLEIIGRLNIRICNALPSLLSLSCCLGAMALCFHSLHPSRGPRVTDRNTAITRPERALSTYVVVDGDFQAPRPLMDACVSRYAPRGVCDPSRCRCGQCMWSVARTARTLLHAPCGGHLLILEAKTSVGESAMATASDFIPFLLVLNLLYWNGAIMNHLAYP